MARKEKPINHVKTRIRSKLSQTEYWQSLGSNQSSGSRYENGKQDVPAPIEMLAVLKYRYGIDLPVMAVTA